MNPFVTLRYSVSVNGQVLGQLGEKDMDSGGYYLKLQEYDTNYLFFRFVRSESLHA